MVPFWQFFWDISRLFFNIFSKISMDLSPLFKYEKNRYIKFFLLKNFFFWVTLALFSVDIWHLCFWKKKMFLWTLNCCDNGIRKPAIKSCKTFVVGIWKWTWSWLDWRPWQGRCPLCYSEYYLPSTSSPSSSLWPLAPLREISWLQICLQLNSSLSREIKGVS